ncbi:MAG TPA: phosphoglucomutase (alpha-D-glucose-1,6-bisphosphate-dependent) [Thermodesulfobacteriota bacterium]|nr:phosphoglucomutase (alpha-D-glucose-1,6-bisphosphate-dependent) [Thermodesulfobacteriota bacterium]
MEPNPLAGKPAPPELLIDVSRLERAYYENQPNPDDPNQLVSFGTSGHRGSPLEGSFNEAHILAITQALCEYRQSRRITGPLFMGKDTHAVSGPAQRTALEVLAASGVETYIQKEDGVTPTPVISHAILVYNRGKASHLGDGIVVTPSHNPPADGGFKYNPPNGGPADTDVTGWVQDRANDFLRSGNREVKRMPYSKAIKAAITHEVDFILPYVRDLKEVIDLDIIQSTGIRMGVDPLGGASIHYWEPIREHYGVDITLVNARIDPTFRFMTVDHDGKIRMDCSSPYAMANLVKMKDRFEVAFGNDTDADRHGIVTPSVGLMNPNDYLAVAISYLLNHRPQWSRSASIGKTLVSSGLIDRVVETMGRRLFEVPVGFKWFVQGLLDGSICFGGEESAGGSFLRNDGTVWVTDKDGIILNLLSAEITARVGKDPGVHYQELAMKLGTPYYTRIDGPVRPDQKDRLKKLSPEAVTATEVAGEPIVAKLTRAPGNNASIGGLKVVAKNGWFAARPSGTENVFKLYAESFKSQSHLEAIVEEAQKIIHQAIGE